jgi:drug/metabolite transporter (DMT)-like permease
VFYEHLLLAAAAGPIAWRARSTFSKISRRTWLAILGTAWVGSALSTILFTYSVRSGDPTTAVLLQQMQPLVALVFARLILGERLSRRFAGIAAVSVCGAYFMVFGARITAPWHSIEFVPAILAFGAAAGWALSTVWGRIAALELPPEVITALRILCALPALLILEVASGPMILPPGRYVPSLLWLALVPGFAALLIYYHGLRTSTASHSTIAELAFPATSSMLNWVLLGVVTTSAQVLAFLVVWSAILYLPHGSVSRPA